jgi:hypothetical protein
MAMVPDPADHSAADGCPVTATNGPLPMGLRSYRPPAQNLTGAKLV